MKYIAIFCCALFTLTGCAVQKSVAERCYDYGYEAGTDGFRDCLAAERRTDRIVNETRRSKPFVLKQQKLFEPRKPTIIQNGPFSQYY